MAGGYIIDPATGQAGVQTASGGFLPLPMSPDQLSAAGLPGPPGTPPAPDAGPDMRLAYNTPPTDPKAWGDAIPSMPPPTQQQQVSDIRAKLMPQQPPAPPASNEHASKPQGPGWMPTGQGQPAPRAAVDPSELARPGTGGGAAPGQQQSGGGDINDPLVRQAMAEAMRQPGGGGPRGLGVAGETRKFQTFENPGGDPAKVAAAQEALGASDKYGEELAKSLNIRQQQAYEAQQAEFAARSGQMAAQQQRFEQQQNMLQDYQAKRDAFVQQAAQLKTPQMEDYWGSRSTFANVMTGLSIALGGALQGLRGGQNPGLEMSNQSIDRWINAQQEDYRRAQGRVTDADNQFAKAVQMFGSENLAASHLREQAWGVRDGMLKSYAEKIGTPSALEAYNNAMLQTEAQRAALAAQNSQGAAVDIEQKLSMQGGAGGGKPKGVLDMLRAGAEAKKLKDELAGEGKEPSRAIEGGKVDDVTSAINTIDAAQEIKKHVDSLGYSESDTDDPLAGPVDYVTKNLPGTQTKRTAQDLERATNNLARGIQQTLGKSDNDAKLADQMAAGGGSGRQRIQAAIAAEKRATAKIQDTLAGMTPDQKNAFIKALPEDRRQRVLQIVQSSAGQAPATSERPF
jgi:hypothetical protein